MKKCVFGFALFLLFNLQAIADTQVYKCVQNGLTSFSQTPCPNSNNTKHDIKSYTPSNDAYTTAQRENQNRQKEYDKLVKIRHQSEAKDEAQRRAAAKQLAVKQKQCDNLKLRTDWAKEDFNNAKLKAQEHARTKLKRSEQLYAMNCK